MSEQDETPPFKATRHTIYLSADSEARLRRLQAGYAARWGTGVTDSVILSRSLVLAEQRLESMSPTRLELLGCQLDVAAMSRQFDEAANRSDLAALHHVHQAAGQVMMRLVKLLQSLQSKRTENALFALELQETAELYDGAASELMRRCRLALAQTSRPS